MGWQPTLGVQALLVVLGGEPFEEGIKNSDVDSKRCLLEVCIPSDDTAGGMREGGRAGTGRYMSEGLTDL